MEVNIMSLELHDFDLILGMDCLSNHKLKCIKYNVIRVT